MEVEYWLIAIAFMALSTRVLKLEHDVKQLKEKNNEKSM